jgi:hypothetical protein
MHLSQFSKMRFENHSASTLNSLFLQTCSIQQESEVFEGCTFILSKQSTFFNETMAAFGDDDMALQGSIEVGYANALDTLDEPVKDTLVNFTRFIIPTNPTSFFFPQSYENCDKLLQSLTMSCCRQELKGILKNGISGDLYCSA